MENKTGHLEVRWLVNETGTIVITLGDSPKYRVNLKAIEPSPRKIRDAIVNAVEAELTERMGLSSQRE